MLARLLYDRIRFQLDSKQSEEQFGFRPKRSTREALLAVDHVIEKSIEWHVPLYILNLDLRKACDRVEHHALFAA